MHHSKVHHNLDSPSDFKAPDIMLNTCQLTNMNLPGGHDCTTRHVKNSGFKILTVT